MRHTYDMRTGQYLTILRITRGWYLGTQMPQTLWREGQTTTDRTTGGPPVLDPQSGAMVELPTPFLDEQGEVGVEIMDEPSLGILGPGGQPFAR